MNSEPKKLSQTISEICAFLDTSVKDYNYNYEQVQVMDKLTQDYLHKLELDGLDYRERAKDVRIKTKPKYYSLLWIFYKAIKAGLRLIF